MASFAMRLGEVSLIAYADYGGILHPQRNPATEMYLWALWHLLHCA